MATQRTSPAATALRGVSLRRAAEVWIDRFAAGNLLTYASAIAFQLLIAAAALVFLGVALLEPLGLQQVWTAHAGPVVREHVPASWFHAIDWSVRREQRTDRAVAVILGVVVSMWEMSGAVRAVMGALNAIYRTRERRSLVHRFALSIALGAVTGALLIAAAFVWIGGAGLPAGFADSVIRLLLASLLCWCVVALLLRFAPARHQPWRWVSGGSLAVIVAWIVVSLAYGAWIRGVVNFHSAEGALAATISTTGYLYASAIAFLSGAQLDQLAREDGLDGVLGGGDA